MGICYSCLGLGRRDSHVSESSRLLDDDLYPSGYGYGSLGQPNHLNQPDPEDLKREREALEAICQKASDSVIDIWASQPQPHLQPRATLRTPVSATSSRAPSGEIPGALTVTEDTDVSADRQQPSEAIITQYTLHPIAVSKHWGEVIISSRKGKKPQLAGLDDSNDFFAVLRVS